MGQKLIKPKKNQKTELKQSKVPKAVQKWLHHRNTVHTGSISKLEPVAVSNSLANDNRKVSHFSDGKVHPVQRSKFPVSSTQIQPHQSSVDNTDKRNELKAKADKLVTYIHEISTYPDFGEMHLLWEFFITLNELLEEVEAEIKDLDQTTFQVQESNLRLGLPVRATQTQNRVAHQDSHENEVERNILKAHADQYVTEIIRLAKYYPNCGTIDAWVLEDEISLKYYRLKEVLQKIKACDEAAFQIQDMKSGSALPVRSTQTQNRAAYQDSNEDIVRRNKLKAEADKLIAEIYEIVQDGDFSEIDDPLLQEMYFTKSARLEEIEEELQICEIAIAQAQDEKLRSGFPAKSERAELRQTSTGCPSAVSTPTTKSSTFGTAKNLGAIPKSSAHRNDRSNSPFVATSGQPTHLEGKKQLLEIELAVEAVEAVPKPSASITYTSARSACGPSKSSASQNDRIASKLAESTATKAKGTDSKSCATASLVSGSASKTPKRRAPDPPNYTLQDSRFNRTDFSVPEAVTASKLREPDPKPSISSANLGDVSAASSKSLGFETSKNLGPNPTTFALRNASNFSIVSTSGDPVVKEAQDGDPKPMTSVPKPSQDPIPESSVNKSDSAAIKPRQLTADETKKADSSTLYSWEIPIPNPISRSSAPLDERLVNNHMCLLDEVLSELYNIVSDVEFDPIDPRCDGILKAKQAQFDELRNQLKVYETVMARAKDRQQQKRESYRFAGRLPAFGKRSEIDDIIDRFDHQNRFLIVQGQTGSGKSTQLPQYIADHPRMTGKKVICTQPRRIAAVALADRVSVEYACGSKRAKVGFPVGYSVGGSRSMTVEGKTKIEFSTESKMLERLMNRREKDFKDIGAVIVDEAHERSITCDILLGMLKKPDPLWNDILIVVASATIDLKAFHKFFDDRAEIVEIDGRMYPVERIYRPPSSTSETANLGENGEIIEAVIEIALEIHTSSGTDAGDILCFLPGADEIRRGAVWLEKKLDRDAGNADLLEPVVYQLSGAQEAEEQRRVFEKLDPKKFRKIILASPIAETSITIDGVVYVIDSGVKKEKTYDPKRNISSLKTVNISQSSALQREGRAGRTRPGVCYKLYSEEDFQTMSINTLPEIFRRPLPLAILYLRKMGIDPLDFDWVSRPDAEAIKSAEEELTILGAIDKTSKRLTDLGDLISQSQQEPKMVRMIFTALKEGAGTAAVKLAAILSVSKSFFNTAGKNADAETRAKMDEKRKSHKDGDILAVFKLFIEYESLAGDGANPKQKKKIRTDWLKKNELNGKSFSTAEKTFADLKYVFCQTRFWRGDQNVVPSDENLLKLFCSGYFLHASCRVNVKSKGRNRLHYFALQPEVFGCLPFKASFVQMKNGNNDVPNWILFDQIMKYPDTGATFFPSTSRIESNWIQNESEEFYSTCLEKQEWLPTEVVEKSVSDTVLKTLFGKRCANLQVLEEELHCSLDAEVSAGFLRAFCSKILLPFVERKLTMEIDRAKDDIRKEMLEQTWLSDTRLVVGPGYEIKSVLFSGEFNALYLRNLDRDCTRQEFERFVYSNIKRGKVSSLQFVPQERSNMGIIRLVKPSDAVSLLNKLRDELNATGSDVIVAPRMGDGYNGTVPKAEQLKLKISWPVGYSVGNATITVENWQDGNKIVDMLPDCLTKGFPFASAIGNLTEQPSKEPRVYREAKGKLKFLEDAIYLTQPVFKVRVKGLSTEVDEFEIADCLKKKLSITPLRVFIKRNEAKESELLSAASNKEKILLPFRNTFVGDQKDVVIADMIDKIGGRAGVLIYHPDTVAVENAFRKLQEAYSGIEAYNQPYRVELERLFTFSVHADLYQCLKPKFKKAVEEIKNWGVWTSVTGPGTEEQNQNKKQPIQKKTKFVFIKFRHTDGKTIRSCRRKLESVLERDVLDAQTWPNIENLFTHTGRLMVEERIPTSNNHYIHWDRQNFRIFVYGRDAAIKRDKKDRLKTILDLIEKWKRANCFEIVVKLNRQALERYQKTNGNYIDSLCKSFNFMKGQYRLIGANKLIVSTGSTDVLERFQKLLETRGLMTEPTAKPTVLGDCGVCFCEVDKEFMITSICNHAFCIACIRPMFTGAETQMPLRCPKCESLLPIQDVVKVAPGHAIPKLNEVALNVYRQTTEGSKIKFCPKPGCNQIFLPNEAGSEGPTFYFCDNCLTDYCLNCTASLLKDVAAHPGLLCKDVQLTEDDKLYRIVNHIRDRILTLRCPRCTAPYFEFDGCAALTCSSCSASFCALCLKECVNDDQAHSHVIHCSYNPIKQVYVLKDDVQKANRRYRIDKLSEYFQNCPELPAVKSKILDALSKDLRDFDIRVTDICSF